MKWETRILRELWPSHVSETVMRREKERDEMWRLLTSVVCKRSHTTGEIPLEFPVIAQIIFVAKGSGEVRSHKVSSKSK